MISLHLFSVSNKSNVSPTLNIVARLRAKSFLVGGPGDSLICEVSWATNCFCFSLISDWNQNKIYSYTNTLKTFGDHWNNTLCAHYWKQKCSWSSIYKINKKLINRIFSISLTTLHLTFSSTSTYWHIFSIFLYI